MSMYRLLRYAVVALHLRGRSLLSSPIDGQTSV